MPTVSFELSGEQYDVEVLSFIRPVAPGWDDPGDAGEVELGDHVKMYVPNTVMHATIRMTDFVAIYADWAGINSQAAIERIDQAVMFDLLSRDEDEHVCCQECLEDS